MPETPEELYERASGELRMPPVKDWETFPFEPPVQVLAAVAPATDVIARPARLPQLIGSFAAIWDDVLPPVPEARWRADLDALVDALG